MHANAAPRRNFYLRALTPEEGAHRDALDAEYTLTRPWGKRWWCGRADAPGLSPWCEKSGALVTHLAGWEHGPYHAPTPNWVFLCEHHAREFAEAHGIPWGLCNAMRRDGAA